jgi:D-beta-D-heptose 7-phosphate kinase/D-beta-D-heptose 1-phosphate adenosyltransferase
VLVIGDVMLDRYWHGPSSRISPEAPVPVVRVQADEHRPGGAGNVALNVAALAAEARVIGVTGDDQDADILEQTLAGAGVGCDLVRQAGNRTVSKLRVLSRHQQLIRLDFEDGFPNLDMTGLRQRLRERLPGAGVVVVSDYGKGTLAAVEDIIATARQAGKPVLVDPKGREFARYRGATMITPNRQEFEEVVGPCPDDQALAERAIALVAELDLEALLITRSEQGMTLVRAGYDPLHLPTRAREVFDVTGAGDTVIGVLAAALAAGLDLPGATALANVGAGIVVGKLGTSTVTVAELHRALHDPEAGDFGVLDEEDLVRAVSHARARGETVVMTNGCFDILHAGHVAYLEQARGLGDRLIIAVNDDASVGRLGKGAGRPVNPLARRMEVLAALKAVDWVVGFGEDTPERLICRVQPDCLVKGGDYRPEAIAGFGCVTARGGQVRVLPYVDGCSTSQIIETIRGAGGSNAAHDQPLAHSEAGT